MDGTSRVFWVTRVSSSGATPLERLPVTSVEPPRGERLSIGEALRGTANSLGILRLTLASLVIFDHAFPLGGFGEDPLWGLTRGQASLGTLAVGGFFAISGYLIAKSGQSGDVVQFLWRRTLRIFPAYWLVLIVTAFVAGPLIWILEGSRIGAYVVGPDGPVNYLLSNWTLTIGSYRIHDLLADSTPYGQAVGASVFNGSIWTLIYEWNCYLIIAVLVAFGILKNARIVVPLLAGFFFIVQVVAVVDLGAVANLVPLLADQQAITLGMIFLIGSVIAVYSKEIPFDHRLGVLAGIVLLVSLRYGGFSTIGVLAGSYFVLYLGAALPRRLHWIGARNDYSYGIYIYGFLVQQIGAYFGWYEFGYVPYVLLALMISFGCAWLSWHAVEKRAMKLKNWGPGRGWRYWYSAGTTLVGRKKDREE